MQSQRLHDFDRLAGLDAMVFHFNLKDPSFASFTNVSPETVPILMIPAGDKRVAVERTGRSPLTDKSRDANLRAFTTPSASKRNPRSVTIKHALPAPQVHPPNASPVSFTPLPLLLSASSLQLPSIFDLALEAGHALAQSTHTSPPSPHDEGMRQATTIPLPALSHPNSPYVPWSEPVRDDIMHPRMSGSHSSAFASAYSRPLSRSGAMAPEPANYSQCDVRHPRGLASVHYSWRGFRHAIKQGVRRVVKRIGCFNQSRRSTSPQYPSPEPEWEEISPPTSFDRSPRRGSVGSVETNSLATWLAERRRLSMERERTARRMAITDYEDNGSWLEEHHNDDDREDSSDEGSAHEIPMYDMFSPGLTSFGDISALTDHRDSVLLTLQQLDELESDPAVAVPHVSDRTVSTPELAAPRSRPCIHSCLSSPSLRDS